MTQIVQLESGAILHVSKIVEQTGADTVFLVTGKSSFQRCGAETALKPLLENYEVVRFADFRPNPRLPDLMRGLSVFPRSKSAVVLAVGGGSTLDMAKLIAICSAQRANVRDIISGSSTIESPGPPVVAIPTTAGSGSQATHFAVVYDGFVKHSVAHNFILPQYAIVDPGLTYSMSPHLTAVSGLDALAQAIESLWSVKSSDESRRFSIQSIRLVVSSLLESVGSGAVKAREGMCRAAHLAGKAINTAKTTGPHATSYIMTSRFGVPHGHAVALLLGEFLVYNSGVTDADVTDSRGPAFVRDQIAEICRLLGCGNAQEAREWLKDTIRQVGLPTTLGELGIRSNQHIQLIAGRVNVERLRNNPRRISARSLTQILKQVA